MARMIDSSYLLKHQRKVKFFGLGPGDESWGYAVPTEIIENAPTLTQPNEPLTLEELREMDGEPVYVVPANEFSELGGWCVISTSDCGDEYSAAYVPGVDCWCWRFDSYGEQWLAYRRPPEGEEET